MSKDLWGHLAGTYDVEHTYIGGADLISTIQSEVAHAVPAGKVVELGCGTGLYTSAYASRCSQVIATDISEPMVEVAKRALANFQNVSVQVADAVSTGLPAGSADGVVAVNLLHSVSDSVAVLTEADRQLRPGGVLVIADATGEGLPVSKVLANIWRGLRRWGLKTTQKGQRNLTLTSLEALIRAAGFASIQGQVLTGPVMSATLMCEPSGPLIAGRTTAEPLVSRRSHA